MCMVAFTSMMSAISTRMLMGNGETACSPNRRGANKMNDTVNIPSPHALALKWALDMIRHRGDCAAGIFCRFCNGTVKQEDYKGMITDKITHAKDCQWVHANNLIGRNSDE